MRLEVNDLGLEKKNSFLTNLILLMYIEHKTYFYMCSNGLLSTRG